MASNAENTAVENKELIMVLNLRAGTVNTVSVAR